MPASITLTTPDDNGLFARLSLLHFLCTMSSTKKDKAISQVILFIHTLGQCWSCRSKNQFSHRENKNNMSHSPAGVPTSEFPGGGSFLSLEHHHSISLPRTCVINRPSSSVPLPMSPCQHTHTRAHIRIHSDTIYSKIPESSGRIH